MKPKKESTYSTAEAAQIEGITERGIRKRLEHGEYPTAFKVPIKWEWRIPCADVDKT